VKRFSVASVSPALFLFFAVAIICGFPFALLADDLPARLALAIGDQPVAAPGSSLRLLPCESGPSIAQAPLVHQEMSSGAVSASTSVTASAPPKRLFSHAKWEGPAAVVSCEPDLQWKGAFGSGRPSSAADDSGVVQVSGELPLDSAQPVSLPNPPLRLGDGPGSPRPASGYPARKPAAEPPLALQVAPSSESSASPQQELAKQPTPFQKCILPGDLKSIRTITADISVKADDLKGNKPLPPECSLGDTPLQPRRWHPITFAWTAASTCHNPLYFEEEQLERYGHSWGNVKQTTISAVQFFATVPMLPYFMGVYPPNECIYDLGQYRPGSCAPYYLDPLPLSVRGALYEGTFLGVLPAL
jgi:hypothetical protein